MKLHTVPTQTQPSGQLEKSAKALRRAVLKELPALLPEERHALLTILGAYLIKRAEEMKRETSSLLDPSDTPLVTLAC